MGEDFEYYCLQFEKSSGMVKISVFCPLRMRVQSNLQMGMKFQGISMTENVLFSLYF